MDTNSELIKIGILAISDRASAGIYEDLSGKTIIEVLNQYLNCKWEYEYLVIADEKDLISKTLISLSDRHQCCLIVTTGVFLLASS